MLLVTIGSPERPHAQLLVPNLSHPAAGILLQSPTSGCSYFVRLRLSRGPYRRRIAVNRVDARALALCVCLCRFRSLAPLRASSEHNWWSQLYSSPSGAVWAAAVSLRQMWHTGRISKRSAFGIQRVLSNFISVLNDINIPSQEFYIQNQCSTPWPLTGLRVSKTLHVPAVSKGALSGSASSFSHSWRDRYRNSLFHVRVVQ